MLANTTTPDGYYVGADGAWIAGQEAPKFDFSIAACSIKYTGHKVFSFDYDGYPCVALYYDYTNKDAEPTGAYLADYYITVFQNGVECDSAFLSYDERKKHLTTTLRRSQPVQRSMLLKLTGFQI